MMTDNSLLALQGYLDAAEVHSWNSFQTFRNGGDTQAALRA